MTWFCSLTTQQFYLSATQSLYDVSPQAFLSKVPAAVVSYRPGHILRSLVSICWAQIPPCSGLSCDLSHLSQFHKGSPLRPAESLTARVITAKLAHDTFKSN